MGSECPGLLANFKMQCDPGESTVDQACGDACFKAIDDSNMSCGPVQWITLHGDGELVEGTFYTAESESNFKSQEMMCDNLECMKVVVDIPVTCGGEGLNSTMELGTVAMCNSRCKSTLANLTSPCGPFYEAVVAELDSEQNATEVLDQVEGILIPFCKDDCFKGIANVSPVCSDNMLDRCEPDTKCNERMMILNKECG